MGITINGRTPKNQAALSLLSEAASDPHRFGLKGTPSKDRDFSVDDLAGLLDRHHNRLITMDDFDYIRHEILLPHIRLDQFIGLVDEYEKEFERYTNAIASSKLASPLLGPSFSFPSFVSMQPTNEPLAAFAPSYSLSLLVRPFPVSISDLAYEIQSHALLQACLLEERRPMIRNRMNDGCGLLQSPFSTRELMQ